MQSQKLFGHFIALLKNYENIDNSEVVVLQGSEVGKIKQMIGIMLNS